MLALAEETKLFQVVAARNPKQVLRYSLAGVEPLWTSDKGRLARDKVPRCEVCGAARQFEMQITPQLFDYCAPLRLVDWDTIVVYTCPNFAKCRTKDQFFAPEFAHVQFSEDCAKANIGVPAKQQEQPRELSEAEKARRAEKNRKKREKAKAKKQGGVQEQVASEVQDLIKDFKL